MCFYRRITWTEHMSNEEVIMKTVTRKTLILKIRKGQVKFLGHIMRKVGLENIIFTGHSKTVR